MSKVILDKNDMASFLSEYKQTFNSLITSTKRENQDQILNRKGLAEYFHVSPNSIDEWVNLGMPYALLGKTKRFSTKSALKWVHEHEVTKPTKKRPIRIVNE
ncbi:hypothetical protein [Lactobacillus johnsonii]|uniref:hypothetical protein n=1 Tax=Lactobacillus johnsonii TaxID=33959 RepID=UPI0017861DAE|nr:hypothetical protein [Lactobacillus johnsonii]QXL48042.1 terminase small subunit [Lactobacillus johnsonii]UOC06006.1 terminase small subunit [Lactobacillus johnsonii]UOC06730.1 terminase small subunit [Lactobacillus johnsonii]